MVAAEQLPDRFRFSGIDVHPSGVFRVTKHLLVLPTRVVAKGYRAQMSPLVGPLADPLLYVGTQHVAVELAEAAQSPGYQPAFWGGPVKILRDRHQAHAVLIQD